MFIDLRETEKQRENERNIDVKEKHWSFASHICPEQGSNPHPRYMAWPGIKRTTFGCTGGCSNQLSRPARAIRVFFTLYFQGMFSRDFMLFLMDYSRKPSYQHSVLWFFFFKIYLLIMLLQLSHFPPTHSILPTPLPPTFPPHSSCPWVILISSLASTFPTLFLPSPCLFSTYHLCYLFSVPLPPSPPPTPLLTTLMF